MISTNPKRAGSVRLVLIVSAVVLAVAGQLLLSNGMGKWAVTPFAVAALCLALVFAARPASALSTPRAAPARKATRFFSLWLRFREREKRAVAVAMLASGLLMALSLSMFASGNSNGAAWVLYGVSMLALLAALVGVGAGWTRLARMLTESRHVEIDGWALVRLAALAGILALALLLRVYEIRDLPAGVWYDEAADLTGAAAIYQDPGNTPVFSRVISVFYLLPVAVLVGVIGVVPEAIRLTSVAFSLAGIIAVFLLARHILGAGPALIAALLLTVSRWDINFSRVGMIPITMSLFTALSAWLTLRALDRRGFADFGLAGFALGVGLWFYAAFQIFPLVIAFMLAHHYIIQKPPFGRFVAQIIFMGIVALLVVLPVAQFAYTNPDVYFARIGDTSIWSNTPFGEAFDQARESFGKHLRMFHFEGDHNPRHNLPGAPMLDIATGLLLVAGAAVALFNWRKTALIVLPVWVIVMLMPGVLTLPFEAPQALRSIGVLPAVVVLAALPLAMLARAIIGAGSWGGRALGLTVVCAVLTVVGYSNVNTYFGEQAADPAVYAAYSTDGTLVGRDMVRQQAKGYTLLASRQFKFSLQIDLAGNRPVYDVIRAPQDVPLAAERVNAGAAIYLEPREKGAFRLLKAYYPDGHFEEVRAPNGGEPLYYLAVLTREQLGERQGLIATYTAADGARTEQVLGSTQALWPLELDEDSLPVDVIWEGALHAREPGEYLFMLEGDTGLHVSLDGQPVLTPEVRTARVELAVGLHEIAVAGQVDSGDEFARLIWQPPGGDVAVIPAANLYHGVIRPYGLAGNFYADGLESDTPDAMRVTPFMDTFWYDPVLPEPYSAVWEGELLASDDGGYRFRVSGFGDVRLSVDGLLVASSDGLTGLSDDSIILRAGWHSVQIRYSSPHPPSEFEILWTPPDGAEGDIPIEYLRPAPDRMIRLIE